MRRNPKKGTTTMSDTNNENVVGLPVDVGAHVIGVEMHRVEPRRQYPGQGRLAGGRQSHDENLVHVIPTAIKSHPSWTCDRHVRRRSRIKPTKRANR